MKRKERSPSPKHRKIHESWKSKLHNILKKEDKTSKTPTNPQILPTPPAPKAPTDPNSLDKLFHLEQSKKRSQIRIDQNRATCFDKLLHISLILSNELTLPSSSDLSSEIQKPYLLLESLNQSDLETTKTSIEVHQQLETTTILKDYWENLLTICDFHLNPQSSFLKQDIENLLKPKSLQDLNKLKLQITQSIDSRLAPDRTFWQEVLKNIELYKARLQIQDLFETRSENPLGSNNLEISSLFFRKEAPKINYGDGSDSPILHNESEILDCEILTPEADIEIFRHEKAEILKKELKLLISSQSRLSIRSNPMLSYDNKLLDIDPIEKIVKVNTSQTIEDMMRIDIMKKMPQDADELEFGELVNIKPVMEDWMKKYKPRKPKFFNRIKTGFEWTRHNQTHFDHLSPPPKVVQGYKFNILYPQLIDKTKAPQFYLTANDENNETCIIRFHSGPPYEDIAFKIINKEWDFSDRNGFKCFFDKGILHLYFNFKRHRYKR